VSPTPIEGREFRYKVNLKNRNIRHLVRADGTSCITLKWHHKADTAERDHGVGVQSFYSLFVVGTTPSSATVINDEGEGGAGKCASIFAIGVPWDHKRGKGRRVLGRTKYEGYRYRRPKTLCEFPRQPGLSWPPFSPI